MKNNLLILFGILLCVSCTTMRDNDRIMYNFSVPKTLSFDLTAQTLLQIDTFNLDMPDTLVMKQLENIEMINLTREIHYKHKKQTGKIIFDDDTVHYNTLPSYFPKRRFYVYGKLDLQPNINSIVVYDISNVRIDNSIYNFDAKHFWLFNFKDNRLLSAILFDTVIDYLPTTNNKNPTIPTVSRKKNVFTDIQSVANYYNGFVKTYYTKYKVNKEGYIKFVR